MKDKVIFLGALTTPYLGDQTSQTTELSQVDQKMTGKFTENVPFLNELYQI